MTAMFNIPKKSTVAQQIRSSIFKLRSAMGAVLSAQPSRPTRLDDDANQFELLRLAHHHREEIRRATDELRRLGVRN